MRLLLESPNQIIGRYASLIALKARNTDQYGVPSKTLLNLLLVLIYTPKSTSQRPSQKAIKRGEQVAEEGEAGNITHAGISSETQKSSTPETLPERLERLGRINDLIYGIHNANNNLQRAVRTENTPLVVDLLKETGKGLDVNAGGSNKEPHLNVAAKGHVGIVKLLIDHGVIPDNGTLNGVTPLLSAVYHGQTTVVQVLIGLDITKPDTVRHDEPDGDGKAPLIIAAK
ncbi:hypothetical protein MMC31_006753 [Peltigera leucophlebia]|nr:hypothetical protein [Peltigera leucophlebia]